jgi:hypothetical protein
VSRVDWWSATAPPPIARTATATKTPERPMVANHPLSLFIVDLLKMAVTL